MRRQGNPAGHDPDATGSSQTVPRALCRTVDISDPAECAADVLAHVAEILGAAKEQAQAQRFSKSPPGTRVAAIQMWATFIASISSSRSSGDNGSFRAGCSSAALS
ncbi:hypothetical protein ACKZDW_14550 [Ralstonia syzygii subsp. celebesensis]